jgi:hypothetical protein
MNNGFKYRVEYDGYDINCSLYQRISYSGGKYFITEQEVKNYIEDTTDRFKLTDKIPIFKITDLKYDKYWQKSLREYEKEKS